MLRNISSRFFSHCSSRVVAGSSATNIVGHASLFNKFGVSQTGKLIRLPSNKTHSRSYTTELTASWPEGMKKFLETQNITQPTLIQEKTIRPTLENRDLVGLARTGSGKTLAFVIPAILKICKARESGSAPLKCLVLAPTRELANQINEVFSKFRFMNIKSIALVGGSSRSEQVRRLESYDHDIYVATPGRLMDLMDSNLVDLSCISYLVLDEADRMLDMGFEPQIRKIVSSIPKERQTLMWSATWPEEIQSLASEFMKEFEFVAIDSEKLKANPNIKQVIKICQPNEKLKLMINCLQDFKEEIENPKVLLFVNTKRLADNLLLQLMRHRIKAITIHGDRSQKQRDDAIRLFKNKMCQVLVATDVAARGLDISDITHVINFDFPNTIEDYVHRIGRTARHERSGTAVTFFTENDDNMAKKLIKVLQETGQEIPEELKELSRYSSNSRPRRDTQLRHRGMNMNKFYSY